MTSSDEIVSANNWLSKAGARLQGESIELPHHFVLVPLTIASEAIVDFRKHDDLSSKIKAGLVVATMVRVADTAFYNKISELINRQSPNRPNICGNCIRGQVFGTKMRQYRKEANRRVIHKMESGEVISLEDLQVVDSYYEEIFKLPLMDPVSIPETKDVQLCQKCRPRWAKHNQ